MADVFRLVQAGELDAGAVAVENSLAGSIGETYDLLITHDLVVTGETTVPIEHCLLARPGATPVNLRRVISHPQALAQCRLYLEQTGLELVPHYNTAGAAKEVAEQGDSGLAAVASRRAAEIYGLEVLATGIADRAGNQTRFFRIAPQAGPPAEITSPVRKWVLAVTLPHQPGSLFMALASFACRAINLTRIESRPREGDPWNYTFYLELESAADGWAVSEALDELRAKTDWCRVLGSFGVGGQRP